MLANNETGVLQPIRLDQHLFGLVLVDRPPELLGLVPEEGLRALARFVGKVIPLLQLGEQVDVALVLAIDDVRPQRIIF